MPCGLAEGKRTSFRHSCSHSCFSFSTNTSFPSPQLVPPAEMPTYAQVTARPSASCNSAQGRVAFSSPHAFPNTSFYPLCQELILSSCFPSPINNPFPPPDSQNRGVPMSCACPEHSFSVFPFSSFLLSLSRSPQSRSRKVSI